VSPSGATGSTAATIKGLVGMKRWVGLGVIADNLSNIGNAMHKHSVR
jgi:IS5 family transposase